MILKSNPRLRLKKCEGMVSFQKMKKIIITFALLIILSSVASALTTLYTENFDFSDLYSNHGYTWSSTCGLPPFLDKPIISVFSTYAFGYNRTTLCASETMKIRKDFTAVDNGVITLAYDFTIINDTSPTSANPLLLEIGNTSTSSSYIGVIMKRDSFITYCPAGLTGCVPCNLTEIGGNYPITLEDNTLSIDLDNKKYTWTMNGSSTGCTDITLMTYQDLEAGGINLITALDNSENIQVQVDNVRVYSSASSTINGTYGINAPCDNNEECISGKCTLGTCVYKSMNEECTSNEQCSSQSCLNGKCTKPSLSESLEASKNENFGDDDKSNNLVAIIIMVIALVGCILGGRNKISALAGVVLFYVLGFVFAYIGWLSPFIVLALVIVALAVMVLLIALFKNG